MDTVTVVVGNVVLNRRLHAIGRLNGKLLDSFSQTQRAMRIVEVLQMVMSQLEDDKPSLASCARSCKPFRPLALDVLWRRLSSHKPLNQLVPRGNDSAAAVSLRTPLQRVNCSCEFGCICARRRMHNGIFLTIMPGAFNSLAM